MCKSLETILRLQRSKNRPENENMFSSQNYFWKSTKYRRLCTQNSFDDTIENKILQLWQQIFGFF